MKAQRKNKADVIYLVAVIAFFYLPILFVVLFSFNSTKSLSVFSGFSLRWYQSMFRNRTILTAIYYTILVAVIATAVSTVVGTITAIGLSKSRRLVRDVALQVNNLPMMNPDIVTAIGLMLFFVALKWETGLATMIIAHITFCIPYVILTVMPKLRSLDDNVAEAALDLGATPWQALTKVIIPQIKDGILAGALIAFTMSFDDFVISFFTTGPGINNISIYVYTMYKRINPSINALSSIIILAIATALVIINVVPMMRKNKPEQVDQPKPRHPYLKPVIAVLVLCLAMAGLHQLGAVKATSGAYAGQVLNVYNAGEYIGEDTISNFEEEYGVTVNYSLFASNEECYTKLQSGASYDVVIPSDYTIQRLISEDMLQPLDKDIVVNWDGMTDAVKNVFWDPDNTYSAPYFWGKVGIVYDTTKVDPADVEREQFAIFKDPKYKDEIFMYDNERDAFMLAFKDLGYSMNTTDPDEIDKAYQWMLEMNRNTNPSYVTDEIIDGMINGEKAIGMVYSGDAAYILSENEDLDYFVPDYGTNLWIDSMVIPKNAKNPELANVFINYMMEYDVAYANSEYVGYTSPFVQVMEDLSGPGGAYEGNSAYLQTTNPNDESYIESDYLRKTLADLWVKVKLSK